ncbi:hypothetical protein JCM11251_004068 [Rhodosporidiobolus azoricus]
MAEPRRKAPAPSLIPPSLFDLMSPYILTDHPEYDKSRPPVFSRDLLDVYELASAEFWEEAAQRFFRIEGEITELDYDARRPPAFSRDLLEVYELAPPEVWEEALKKSSELLNEIAELDKQAKTTLLSARRFKLEEKAAQRNAELVTLARSSSALSAMLRPFRRLLSENGVTQEQAFEVLRKRPYGELVTAEEVVKQLLWSGVHPPAMPSTPSKLNDHLATPTKSPHSTAELSGSVSSSPSTPSSSSDEKSSSKALGAPQIASSPRLKTDSFDEPATRTAFAALLDRSPPPPKPASYYSVRETGRKTMARRGIAEKKLE